MSEKATARVAIPGWGSREGQNGLFWGPPGTIQTENRAGALQRKVFGSPKWKFSFVGTSMYYVLIVILGYFADAAILHNVIFREGPVPDEMYPRPGTIFESK